MVQPDPSELPEMRNIPKVRPLKLEPVKHVAVAHIPLSRAARQSRCAVDQTPLINAQHAHLLHGADECKIPCTLAQRKRVEWDHSERVLRNALVRGQREWRLATPGLRKVLVVPCTNGGIEFLR